MGSINRVLRFVFWFVLVFYFGILSFSEVRAQNWNEIFRQQKTQEKYLLKQLAYLKLYAGYLKQGYEIVDGGLQTIKGFTSGEFSLHEAFFGSLKLVSPVVRNNKKVAEIAVMQVKIISGFSAMLIIDLAPLHLDYIRYVRDGVITECAKDLEELLMVITASELELSDDERLVRLSKVHASMDEKYRFVLEFYAQVQQLSRAVEMERSGLERLRRLYERD